MAKGKKFADEIKSLRINKGMTQQELISASGLSQRSLTLWEGGRTLPTKSDTDLVRLASALGTTYENLKEKRDADLMDREADGPPRPLPIEAAIASDPMLMDERATYRQYRMDPARPGAKGSSPAFMHLAAGPGGHPEATEEVYVLPELKRAKNITPAIVRGDSMLNTLRPGDIILLENLDGGTGLKLPALEEGEQKADLGEWRARVPEGGIYALSLDGGHSVTLKRIFYTLGGRGRWYMQIVADNPAEFQPMVVASDREVVVYAKMIGFGKLD